MELKATINRLFDAEKGNTRAIASLNIGGAFAVHGIKVISGPNGEFVSMSATKQADGKYKDIFHAVTADARQEMNEAVLEAYEQKLSEQEPAEGQVLN
jgi:stage V sporulation protein G